MKQAEHPPVTAGANSAAEYSLAIIDQLARIDRTCSKEEMDELVYRLLAFVGGHLGSARENLRMLTLLEEKQKSLEQNLQAVKLEQQMLKALCKDSTSVYRVDLMNDRAEIVKIEERSNSAGDLLPHGQELFSYAEAVEHYYHKCVLKESAPDFLQFLDAENLMRELRPRTASAAATRVCRTPSGTSLSRCAPIGCSRRKRAFKSCWTSAAWMRS